MLIDSVSTEAPPFAPQALSPGPAPLRRSRTHAARPAWRINVRRATPREMSALSMDLYVAGVLGYEEYAMLGFQAELHPDYARTVGALTGVKAQPDRSRDYVELWERRLDFERTHNPENAKLIERTRHVLAVLRRFETAVRATG